MGTTTALFDADRIARRIDGLAVEISGRLPPDILLIGILKAAFVFTADLARALSRRGMVPEIEFIRLASYGQATESADDVRLIGDVPPCIAGRSVLLVDAVADSGRSLAFACRALATVGAGRVWTCVLLDKPARRRVPITLDFVGFVVPDVFVVGYGLDQAETHRHLPYIGRLA